MSKEHKEPISDMIYAKQGKGFFDTWGTEQAFNTSLGYISAEDNGT
jgi:hypothetical protein